MNRPALAAIGALAIAVAAWLLWRRAPDAKAGPPSGAVDRSVDTPDDPQTAARREAPVDRARAPSSVAPGDGGGPELTFDRAKRDKIREAIWRAFGEAPPDAGAAPKADAIQFLDFVPPPPEQTQDASIDPKFIQQNVRSQFFGPASDCYSEAIPRLENPKGRIEIYFEIVGDEKVGGIVERVEFLNESTLRDPAMLECMRQSFLSVTFPPPKGGGMVTVVYPLEFSPDEPDE